jgi:hypothetical protein
MTLPPPEKDIAFWGPEFGDSGLDGNTWLRQRRDAVGK